MFDSADTIATLQLRLSIHRRTIGVLEAQRSAFGAYAPPYIYHQLDEARAQLAQVKRELRQLGAEPDDAPGDTLVETATVVPALPVVDDALRVYTRMLFEQTRVLSLAGLSSWSDLDIPLTEAYVERSLLPLSTTAHGHASLSMLAAVPQCRLILEGAPGSGKTVLLRRLAHACAASLLEGGSDALIARWSQIPLPLFINARDLAATQRQSTLWMAIEASLREHDLGELVPVLQRRLQEGTCLVLVDGLDDPTDDASIRGITTGLTRFIARYPDNRYIIACRSRDTAPLGLLAGAGFLHYTPAPLADQDVSLLLRRWYPVVVQMAGLLLLDDLETRIAHLCGQVLADERLRRMLTQPLACAVLVLAHTEGLTFPGARLHVARHLYDLLIDRWEQIRSGGALPNLMQQMMLQAMHVPINRSIPLEHLALAFQARPDQVGDVPAALPLHDVLTLLGVGLQQIGVDERRLTDRVRRLLAHCVRQRILVPHTCDGTFTMPARWLREHLAGQGLARRANALQRLYALRSDARWREPLLLACRELAQGNGAATVHKLVHLLLQPTSPRDAARDSVLAAEILLELGETIDAAGTLRAEITQRLLGLSRFAMCPLTDRVRAGMVLGMLGDPRFAGWLPPVAHVGGGAFVFGTSEGFEDEGPIQWSTVDAFTMGVYPVTNLEYARYLAERPDSDVPRYWCDARFNNPSQPVVGITLQHAIEYCQWLTERLHNEGILPHDLVVRLPTEVEWEKAATWNPRQRIKRRFPWGDSWSSMRANTAEGRGTWVTTPVGCYPAGVSAYGIHDMIGNIWEWTISPYRPYPGNNQTVAEPENYVLRGSSCATLPMNARGTYRSRLPATHWRYHLGFRIVLAAPLEQTTDDGRTTAND